MKSYKDLLNLETIPKHVAVIMDGNGRWAKSRGKARIYGHKNGVKAVRETTEAAAEIGVKYLTLYAFSTENWARPTLEVNALMRLLVETIKVEIKTLQDNKIRLNAIGEIKKLPNKTQKSLADAIKETSGNNHMTLTLALNYSGRWDLKQAMSRIAHDIQTQELTASISEEIVSSYLSTAGIPDPELLIRSSGERRISNFLLWQCAYTEFYFTPKLWPDMTKEDFYQALWDFQNRERRFGKTSEQMP